MLKTHHLSDGTKYPPYGNSAAASEADDDEWLPLPVDSDGNPNGLVAQAIRDFRLDRHREGSGLSVVVPYPREPAEGDDDLPRGHDYFVRGHLRIPAMDFIRNHNARALLLVEGDSELGHMLRDAERPAHASWDPHAQRLKDRWIGGYARVLRVRRAAQLILQRLVERPEERQFDALADLFPSDLDAARGRSRRQRSGTENPDTPSPGPIVPRVPSPVRLAHIEGGFSFRASPGAAPAGSTWDMRFAYAVIRGGKGRAFRQFEQGVNQKAPDFTMRNGLSVNQAGCEYEVLSDNAIRVGVLNDDFRLTVTGFDERDVLVEADEAPAIDGPDLDDDEAAA